MSGLPWQQMALPEASKKAEKYGKENSRAQASLSWICFFLAEPVHRGLVGTGSWIAFAGGRGQGMALELGADCRDPDLPD